MTRDELVAIIDAVGGEEVLAGLVPCSVRAVYHWLAGTRNMRPVTEARVRSLGGGSRTSAARELSGSGRVEGGK